MKPYLAFGIVLIAFFAFWFLWGLSVILADLIVFGAS